MAGVDQWEPPGRGDSAINLQHTAGGLRCAATPATHHRAIQLECPYSFGRLFKHKMPLDGPAAFVQFRFRNRDYFLFFLSLCCFGTPPTLASEDFIPLKGYSFGVTLTSVVTFRGKLAPTS